MFIRNISLLLSTITIQMIAGQCLRSAYNTGVYSNEIAAANIVAETAALASAAAAGIAYGPVANAIAYAPVYEPICSIGVPGLTFGLSLAELAASNGNGLRVRSGSPIPPSGVTVESDNMLIEGPLAVSGQLPFLGVVALEGPLPAAGAGAVAYGCGNGNVGIVNENVAPVAPAYPNAYAPGYPSAAQSSGYPNALGLGYPAGPGCGCAAMY
ncbi:chorion class B protein PC10-like [Vanessa tameamea]|uniref:Chorion class B protein PC10-like n=1 Tax=Vanessa tameamea TaxID=334116 RepID=A0A8B8I0I7_VANTA|nr:chorion class B protein PC10-like [Vanessa tameamea]